MLEQAIVIYCVCDEVVKTLNLQDDIQPLIVTYRSEGAAGGGQMAAYCQCPRNDRSQSGA